VVFLLGPISGRACAASCEPLPAGPTRKVPGRKEMTWEEEDWIDEDTTAHRGEDE